MIIRPVCAFLLVTGSFCFCFGQNVQNPCTDLVKLRPANDAAAALDKIISAVGFDPGTILLYVSHDDYVATKGGAMSVLCNSTYGTERWIIYDSDRIDNDRLRNFVFAHEIAHHVNNHALTGGGRTRQEELQADYYGARYLARLKWTKNELLNAFDQLRPIATPREGYPSFDERRASVIRGFDDESGQAAIPATSASSAIPNQQPSPAQPVPPGLVRSADGSLSPAPAYEWTNPSDPKNLDVKLKIGLDLSPNGDARPAAGYEWVNPNDLKSFDVKLKPGLVRKDDGMQPDGGYEWVNPNDLKSLDVRLKTGLVRKDDGLQPDAGYEWVNPNDLKSFDVKLKTGLVRKDGGMQPDGGYEWVNPNDLKNLDVRLKTGLVRNADGTLQPAPGYTWVNSNDPNNFDVKVR